DFPDMLRYKARLLAASTPKCRVERIAVDLNDPSARTALWSAIGGKPALMITEGLLMYLLPGSVEGLAAESGASGVRYWLLDLVSAEMVRRIHQDSLEKVRAPGHVDGRQLLEMAGRNGWNVARRRSYLADALEAAPDRVRELAGKAAAAGQTQPPPQDD